VIPPLFIVLAAVAVLAGLAFAVLPLLIESPEQRRLKRRLSALDDLSDELDPEDLAGRRARLQGAMSAAPGRSSGPLLLIGLLIAVPAATVLLYRAVGEPAGLSRDGQQVHVIRDALIEIADSLERNPQQPELWVRLGLSYKDLQAYSSAVHALRRALYIDNGNPFIQVELAETLLFASGTNALPPEAAQLLTEAAASDPENQKALWLLGIDAFQRGEYETAVARWQALDRLLPEGSVRSSIREQIDRARQAMGSAPPANLALPPNHPSIAESNSGTTPAGPVFPVQISISEELAEGLTGSETVFLIARASNGPPAPLAVRRFTVEDLPYQVQLSDRDAMIDGLMLSAFPEITITARVSLSGQAEPQPGDLQGDVGPLSILETAGAELQIDRVL